MLDWTKLLNSARRKDLCKESDQQREKPITSRTEFERDYDRILFATPTRRLADKTQVFPMEENDSVRNRLTHSHEVSNLARSIGIRLAFDHADAVFGCKLKMLNVKRDIPAILAAVGLAHDMGNPPFGHQGERAIQEWFTELEPKRDIKKDFELFDGNAQTFRLLTKLQLLNDKFGLNLTVGTLAASLKYPCIYGSYKSRDFKKSGVFKSEEEIVKQVWDHTGLDEGVRHPLAYVMEACDDIAYSIIDAEDTVKKGYASFNDLMDHLKTHGSDDQVVKKVIDSAIKENRKYKKGKLSSAELNDISMQMFRVYSISEMIDAVTEAFVANVDKIMNRDIDKDFELVKSSRCYQLCKLAKDFDFKHGYQHKDVLKLELKGNNYIKRTMTMLWDGIVCQGKNSAIKKRQTPFENYAFGLISENYRRVFDDTDKCEDDKFQLLCDAISGMTENYLIKIHDQLTSLRYVKP
ncbi:MAG: dNTP triphosphohydrolase [Wenzhouxiangellaceae bacterium]